jgi:hypothetical protein
MTSCALVGLADGFLIITDGGEISRELIEGSSEVTIQRQGEVNPEYENDRMVYYSDLARSGGPKLGPFDTKQDAIEAEIDYILENL